MKEERISDYNMLKANIEKREIVLSEIPNENIPDGLLIKMDVVIHILERKENGFIIGNITKGVDRYKLPKDLDVDRIKSIYIKVK